MEIRFAIEPCCRELLGCPVARYSTVFVSQYGLVAFCIGTQVQIGERKHAVLNRRLQEDDFVMKCIRQIVQVWLSLRMCAM